MTEDERLEWLGWSRDAQRALDEVSGDGAPDLVFDLLLSAREALRELTRCLDVTCAPRPKMKAASEDAI